MNNTKQMIEALCTKVEAERNIFREKMCAMKPTELYDAWYRINFYESYYGLLTSDEIMLRHPELIEWLVGYETPLEQLYVHWIDCDGHFSGSWEDMIDWLLETHECCKEDDEI